MKTILKLVWLPIVLFSCTDFSENHFDIDPLIKPAIVRFYNLSPKRLSNNLIVTWGNVIEKEGVIAITYHESIPRIVIDYSIQEKVNSDPLFFETVVYHELGHAIFLREHCDCHSLMNPNKYVQSYRMDSVSRLSLIKEIMRP